MSKRAPLTEAEKDYIWQQKQRGGTLAEISKELDCAYETARKWWRHRRDGTQPRRRGRPAEGILSSYPAAVRTQAITLKQSYPHRGPERVRLDLQDSLQLAETDLPSASRLAALFQEACPEAVKVYQQRQYPERVPLAGRVPHELWQMDGKEKVAVGENDVATVLNIRDPYSSVMLASQPFLTTTAQGWRKLTRVEVQNTLRQAFTQWGRPFRLQTDREVVYIGSPGNSFPSSFTLWLVGLHIEHGLIRSRRPTDQAQVERAHRTLGDWTWNDCQFATLSALQEALIAANQLYNERYPVRSKQCAGRPPLQVYPQAIHSGRAFHPAAEWHLFDLQRVDTFLAAQVWTRTANANGTVRVANYVYHLGRAHAGHKVSVTFLPETRSFRFATTDGQLLAEQPAQGLSKADIIGLTPLHPDWPRLQQPFQLPLPLEGV